MVASCSSVRPLRAIVALIALVGVACSSDDDSAASSTASPPTTLVAPTTSVAPSTTAAPAARTPIVIDTDLASDDIVAIAYLAMHPEVEIVAVTVAGTGLVSCPRGAEVARGLLHLLDENAPVACGQAEPLSGDHAVPPEWRRAADNFYGLVLPSVAAVAQPSAVDLLVSTISDAPNPVTLLTLGPLTNVAAAMAEDASFADAVERVVIMGGAVDVPGNVEVEGADPLPAEWNLYLDPAAAAAVVASGAAVTLVSLDSTNAVPLDAAFVSLIEANDRTEATATVVDLLRNGPPPYLWDPLAAVAATDPDLVPGEDVTLDVIVEGDDAGRTIRDPDGEIVSVAASPAPAAVLDHLVATMAGIAIAALERPAPPVELGAAEVSFDGEICTYDGPTEAVPGVLDVDVVQDSTPFVAIVARLIEGATPEEVMAWVEANPDGEPPMVAHYDLVGGPFPSPAEVTLEAGTTVVACSTQDGTVWFAASIDVAEAG